VLALFAFLLEAPLMDPISQFRMALSERQILAPAEIVADGKIHRCDAEGKNGRGDAAYLLHLDGVAAGGFENHRDGRGWENWRATGGRKLSVAEEASLRARISEQRRQREQEDAARLVETRERAKAIWEASARLVGDHPYLTTKQIQAHKARLLDDDLTVGGMACAHALVVPMRDADGAICQLQFISADGEKRYLPGPKPASLYFSIGSPGDVVCITEGYATAASIHEATGHAVAVAFDCGNLEAVARLMREKLPKATIVLCADDDYQTTDNPGITKATAAARSINARLAVPNFGPERPDRATDFNDLARLQGADAVKRGIAAASTIPPISIPPEAEPMAGLVCAASINPEPINWFWDGWLAGGKLHILAGAPGTGKTTVALAFAATISCGGRWPDGTRAAAGHVLIWSSEDDAKDTLVPRLIAMGANLKRVHFIQTAADGDRVRAFDPATDIAQLRATIKRLGIRPDLLIVDPIVSAVAGDSHKGSETRRSLQPLVDLGVAEGCAVLGISHFSKGTAGRDVIERVTGSLAFGALARLVFAAAKMPDDQGGGRFIARAKSNIGIDGGGFKYELQQQALTDHAGISASVLLWGEAIQGNARDILAQAEVTEDPETRSQTSEAEDWLRDLLMAGQVKATDAIKKAKGAGISEKALRAARERLGVKPKKQAYTGGWVWALPHAQDAQPSQDAQDAQTQSVGVLGTFDNQGHLGKTNGTSDDEVF
jgi:putative DNA primase/helicase